MPTHKHLLQYGALAVFGVALYYAYRHHGLGGGGANIVSDPTSANTVFAPNYLTYNTPKLDISSYGTVLPNVDAQPSGSPLSQASLTNPSASQPSCGCASGGQLDNGFLANINDLSAFFVQSAQDVVKKYSENVLSAFPTTFTQFINNPTGSAFATTSQGALAGNAQTL